MTGPFPAGEHQSLPEPNEFAWERGRMVRQREYAVVKSFSDADGFIHSSGERWTFLGAMFSKFEDLLTLCVKKGDGSEWRIPLVWEPSKHEQVIEGFVPIYVRLTEAAGQ